MYSVCPVCALRNSIPDSSRTCPEEDQQGNVELGIVFGTVHHDQSEVISTARWHPDRLNTEGFDLDISVPNRPFDIQTWMFRTHVPMYMPVVDPAKNTLSRAAARFLCGASPGTLLGSSQYQYAPHRYRLAVERSRNDLHRQGVKRNCQPSQVFLSSSLFRPPRSILRFSSERSRRP